MLTAQDIKERLTPDDIDAFMCKALNAGPSREDGQGNRIFLTVDRHPENPEEGSYKLYYYTDSHNFVSYTGGETFDIFSLVQRVKNCSFLQARNYICSFFNINTDGADGFTELEPERTDDWDILEKYADYDRQPEGLVEREISPTIMEFYSRSYPQEWIDDGISVAAMEKYGIRMDVASRKVIIPHHDDMGNIVGIRGRAFDPREIAERGKYAPVVINGKLMNHALSDQLYGLYEAKEAIQALGKVCIVESEKGCLQSYTLFGDMNFTVATCGSGGLSSRQIDLLLKYGVREIILGYDKEFETGDEETMHKYEAKLLRITQPLAPLFDVYVIFDYEGLLPYKAAPTDAGRDVLLRLMKTKRPVRSISMPMGYRRT